MRVVQLAFLSSVEARGKLVMEQSGLELWRRWQVNPRRTYGTVGMSSVKQQRQADWGAMYESTAGSLQAPLDLVADEGMPQAVVDKFQALQHDVQCVVPYSKAVHRPGRVRHNGGRVFVWDGAMPHERLVTVHLEESNQFLAIHYCSGLVAGALSVEDGRAYTNEYEEVLNALEDAWGAMQLAGRVPSS